MPTLTSNFRCLRKKPYRSTRSSTRREGSRGAVKKWSEPAFAKNSPLVKGGSAKGAGVVWQSRKAKGRGWRPVRDDVLRQGFPIRKTTPGRLPPLTKDLLNNNFYIRTWCHEFGKVSSATKCSSNRDGRN